MGKSDIFSKIQDFWFETRVDFLKSISFTWSFLHLKILTFSTMAVNAAIWLFANYISNQIGLDKIALHYNVDFGIDFYGDTRQIYTVPLLGTIILAFNFLLLLIISRNIKKDIRFISSILLVTALVANIILLGAVTSIYFVNFR